MNAMASQSVRSARLLQSDFIRHKGGFSFRCDLTQSGNHFSDLDADEDLKHISSDNVTLMRKPIDIDALLLFLEEREFVAAPKH